MSEYYVDSMSTALRRIFAASPHHAAQIYVTQHPSAGDEISVKEPPLDGACGAVPGVFLKAELSSLVQPHECVGSLGVFCAYKATRPPLGAGARGRVLHTGGTAVHFLCENCAAPENQTALREEGWEKLGDLASASSHA